MVIAPVCPTRKVTRNSGSVTFAILLLYGRDNLAGKKGWRSVLRRIRPVTVLLQHLQGEGIGFYLPMPALYLLRPTKVVESFVCHQEY